jgi:hypothetical protein
MKRDSLGSRFGSRFRNRLGCDWLFLAGLWFRLDYWFDGGSSFDIAAWHHTGRIERHRKRLITRMQAKGIAPKFAERVFEQIKASASTAFLKVTPRASR